MIEILFLLLENQKDDIDFLIESKMYDLLKEWKKLVINLKVDFFSPSAGLVWEHSCLYTIKEFSSKNELLLHAEAANT